MEFTRQELEKLGLDRRNWYLLKDAVLGASYHSGISECKWYEQLPDSLKEHEVGVLVRKAIYSDDKEALGKAAAILTGGSEKAWLFLAKS